MKRLVALVIAAAALALGLATGSPAPAGAVASTDSWDAGSGCTTYLPGSPHVAANQYKVMDCWFNKYYLKVHLREDFFNDGMRHMNTDMYWNNVLVTGGNNLEDWHSDQIMLLMSNNYNHTNFTWCSAWDSGANFDRDPNHYRNDGGRIWHDIHETYVVNGDFLVATPYLVRAPVGVNGGDLTTDGANGLYQGIFGSAGWPGYDSSNSALICDNEFRTTVRFYNGQDIW